MMKIAMLLVKLFAKTWKIRVIGKYPAEKSVIAFWHGYMFPVWKEFAGKNSAAIVSTSKDGNILSSILEDWNYDVARGSSSKKGSEALAQITQYAKEKRVLITPDGPRGPWHEAKAGAFIAAMRAEVPLVFCEVKIYKAKVFDRSWDKHEFPLPFTKVDLIFHDPILIDNESSKEEIDKLITEINTSYK